MSANDRWRHEWPCFIIFFILALFFASEISKDAMLFRVDLPLQDTPDTIIQKIEVQRSGQSVAGINMDDLLYTRLVFEFLIDAQDHESC